MNPINNPLNQPAVPYRNEHEEGIKNPKSRVSTAATVALVLISIIFAPLTFGASLLVGGLVYIALKKHCCNKTKTIDTTALSRLSSSQNGTEIMNPKTTLSKAENGFQNTDADISSNTSVDTPKSLSQAELKTQSQLTSSPLPPLNAGLGETEWLNNMHIWHYCKYLSARYPQLFVPLPFTPYVADSVTFGNDVKHCALADLHLSNPCCHEELSENLGSFISDCKNKTIYYYPILIDPVPDSSINLNHWTGLLIDTERRTVEYYNSFVRYGEHKEIIQTLETLTASLSTLDPNPKGAYRFSEKITKRLQTDGYECGIWDCLFVEKRLENPDVDFNTLEIDIHEYRKHVSAIISRAL